MKKRLLVLLKIAISAAIIGWLLHRADLHRIGQAVRTCDTFFFLLIALCVVFMNLAQVVRWRLLLGDSAPQATFPKLLQFHMISIFFQSFLPSSMSVDIVKGYLLSKTTDSNKAYGSVAFGRILGMVVLFVFFGVVLIAKPHVIMQKEWTWRMVWAMTFFFLCTLVIFSKKVSRFIFSRFPRLSANRLFLKAKAFREELYNYRYSPKATLLALLLSAAISLCSILAVYFAFRAVYFNTLPLLVCMIYVPVIYALMLIPISINGIGLREGLLLLFFASWKLNFETLISASLLNYAVEYSLRILGGVVYLFSDIKGVKRVQEKA